MNKVRSLRLAAHVLVRIVLHTCDHPEPPTAHEVADSVGNDHIVIRRILAQLKAAGLVVQQRRDGEDRWSLTRDSTAVTMADVDRALTTGVEPTLPRSRAEPRCVGGDPGRPTRATLRGRADDVLSDALATTTLADVIDDVLQEL